VASQKSVSEIVMFVRHGEKPGQGSPPHGVDPHGEVDTTARASLIVLLLCLLPRAIQASPIQLNFGGTVNAVEDPFGLIASLVAIGDPIPASVRYDTTTTDLFTADPTRGTYLSPGG
jgi:hypothetical protein